MIGRQGTAVEVFAKDLEGLFVMTATGTAGFHIPGMTHWTVLGFGAKIAVGLAWGPGGKGHQQQNPQDPPD